MTRFISLLPVIAAAGLPVEQIFAQAAPSEEDIFELSPFTVSSSGDAGYYASQTLAGGRINTQLEDVATSVQVVTEEFLRDIGAVGMSEVLAYTTNTDVTGSATNYTAATAGLDRGLSSEAARQDPSNANRIRALGSATRTVNYFQTDIPFDSYVSGRIDINRGANSFLFGLGSPGGIVNSQLAAAEFRDENVVDVRVSTENFEDNSSIRASINVNKVIIEDKLAVRIATMGEDAEFTQQPAMSNTSRHYAAVSFKPFQSQRITVRAHYEKGHIDAIPVDRLGPLENLSSFLNNTSEISWLTPTGRMAVDGYNNILANSAINNGGYMGLDANGKAISHLNNPTGAPVGRKWVMVYDDTVTADGLPTRAFQLQQSNLWLKGNPQLDPDNNFVGSRNIVYTGVPSLQNIGGKWLNWIDPGLLEYTPFDFRRKLIGGTLDFYSNDFDQKNITLEALTKDGNYGIELAFDKQVWRRDSLISLGSPRIAIDINKTLPVGPNDLFGMDNPNFGRVMVFSGAPNRTDFENIRETRRATAFAKFNSKDHFESGVLSWLGRHTLTGLYDYNKLNNHTFRTVMIGEGGDIAWHLGDTNALSNNRRSSSIFYLGPPQLEAFSDPSFSMADFIVDRIPDYYRSATIPNDFQIPVAYWNMGNPATDVNWQNPVGDESTKVTAFNPGWQPQSGSLTMTKVESLAINLQSFFVNDLLVANLGWRKDEVTKVFNGSPPTDPETVPILDPEVFNLDGKAGNVIDNTIFSYGLVLKVPDRWLPKGITLSFHYGESENFIPNPGGVSFSGELVPSASGDTTDYGFTIGMFDRKLIARLNWYEGNIVNEPFSPMNTAYRWTGTNGVLFNLGRMFIELDKNDRNRDGIFDMQLGTDGVMYDPDLNKNGQLDELEGDGKQYLKLGDLIKLENAYNAIVTPFAIQQAEFVRTSGADTANGEPTYTSTIGLWSVLADTANLTAEGLEFELIYNPSNNLRIALNVTQQQAQRSDIAPRYTELWDQILAVFEEIPEAARAPISQNKLSTPLLASQFASNALYGELTTGQAAGQSYLFNKSLEGSDNPEVREWRVNAMANYNFVDGPMKGTNIGAAYRWQDKAAIGYALAVNPFNNIPYPDPTRPYYDDGFDFVDLWVGYARTLYKGKIDWRIQLNVRNVFADKSPLPVHAQPDGSLARVSIPAPREFLLTNSFRF